MKIRIDRKTFNLLRRIGVDGMQMPRSRFDYQSAVGDGLGSAVIVAPLLWVMRQFTEAKLAVRDPKGKLHYDHPLVQLLDSPNEWYGGGTLRMALVADFTLAGLAYIEIGRGRGRRPEEAYYIPSIQIEPKGTADMLITHYEQSTEKGPRRLDREDVVQIRYGINPKDQKRAISPIQSLLREVFTDDEAANMTAAILRNLGVPGVMIAPKDSEAEPIEPDMREKIKSWFRRTFRGDNAGDALVSSEPLDIKQFEVDLAKMNVDKLRQIPEERVCAVLGVPAAVVGFGTGMEQTKVGATMKELRELGYENCIIPIQRMFSEELNRSLLPEFQPDPTGWSVVFDNSEVRVLQEDENRTSERLLREYQGGVITRAENREKRGWEVRPGDDVYRVGFSDIFIEAGQMPEPPAEQRSIPGWVTKAIEKQTGQDERWALYRRFVADAERLAAGWADELEKEFQKIGDRVAEMWLQEQMRLASRNGQIKADPPYEDQQLIDEIIMMLGGDVRSSIDSSYDGHYLRVLRQTRNSIESAIGLAVELTEPMDRAVVALGGTRKGLIDFDAQLRRSMYDTIASARDEGLGPPAIARRIRDEIPAGPWNSSKTRAEVIARTETKYAQNVSSMEVYRNAENVTHIQVFDAQLGDTDEGCMALNGQVLTIDEASALEPLEHPNCTRSFAPVVGAPVEV